MLAWIKSLFGPYEPKRKLGYLGHIPPRSIPPPAPYTPQSDALRELADRGYYPGAVVRQYVTSSRLRYVDATILAAHEWGGLDVMTRDGVRYGWSAGHCEPVLRLVHPENAALARQLEQLERRNNERRISAGGSINPPPRPDVRATVTSTPIDPRTVRSATDSDDGLLLASLAGSGNSAAPAPAAFSSSGGGDFAGGGASGGWDSGSSSSDSSSSSGGGD